MSNSLRPHGLQHTRPPYPSPTPRACSNSCPSSQWCHSTISSSVIPFSFYLQSLPASGSFPVTQFFVSGGQSIGAPVSASVLPMYIQDWFPLELTGLISLQSEDSQESFPTPQFKSINSLVLSFLYGPIKVDQGSPIKEKENLTRNFTKCRMSFSVHAKLGAGITYIALWWGAGIGLWDQTLMSLHPSHTNSQLCDFS